MILAFCAGAGGDEKERAGQAERDEDLSRRLVRKARTGTDEDVMATIIRLMDETAHKLEIEFDASPETQGLQAEVLARLDEAILQAAQQRQTAPKDQQSAAGDRRRKPKDSDRSKKDDAKAQSGEMDSQPSGSSEGGSASTSADPTGGKMDDSRRGWGHLPRRERDEIVQGFGEDFLEQYREWIERYYRALQEKGE